VNSTSIEEKLARVMLWGVLAAAAIMLVGGLIHLVQVPDGPVGDHIFRGEPRDLRDPVAIVTSALQWNELSFIQLGVLLLLLNPLLRVILSAVSFARDRNRTFLVVSLLLVAILCYSLVS
jgi:uncharacterized membrane protein